MIYEQKQKATTYKNEKKNYSKHQEVQQYSIYLKYVIF